ncbi:hypothetical protein OpiT1DRAFT_00189 [Opitutaceae bacterium TAV1]|nr:hypothetical protein OpiT1DRAFT_00189 [Opitutaceae bacterium TAV1]
MARPSVEDRAAMFIEKARPSISGQGGNAALYSVAAGLVIGFGLDDAKALSLLRKYNSISAQPPWPENELERTIRNARKAAERDPGAVGELARQDASGYTGPRLPANIPAPAKSAEKAAPAGSSSSGSDHQRGGRKARTLRTPFFEIRRAGEGAKRRTVRTLRTFNFLSDPISKQENPPEEIRSEKEASEVSPVLKSPARMGKSMGSELFPVGSTYIDYESGIIWKRRRDRWTGLTSEGKIIYASL